MISEKRMHPPEILPDPPNLAYHVRPLSRTVSAAQELHYFNLCERFHRGVNLRVEVVAGDVFRDDELILPGLLRCYTSDIDSIPPVYVGGAVGTQVPRGGCQNWGEMFQECVVHVASGSVHEERDGLVFQEMVLIEVSNKEQVLTGVELSCCELEVWETH